jgi:hypothetical protein
MGSRPQSQDVEHQSPPVADDLRIGREAAREGSFVQHGISRGSAAQPTRLSRPIGATQPPNRRDPARSRSSARG